MSERSKRLGEAESPSDSALKGESGASLIEAMMATVIFGLTAAALLPMLSDVKKSSGQTNIRAQCMQAVRAKLQEYAAGQDVAMPTVSPYLLLTPLSSDWSGTAGVNAASTASSRGFFWAKLQYSRYFPRICASSSNATSLATLQSSLMTTAAADQQLAQASFQFNFAAPFQEERYLGVRECLSQSTVNELGSRQPLANVNASGGSGCISVPDLEIQKQLPGFKLFVKMELESAFRAGKPTGTAAAGREYDEARHELDDRCPFRLVAGRPIYDFDGAGEGIRITASGVVDFPPPRATTASANDRLAGIPRSNRSQFVCSASTTIKPDPSAVRFYMSYDGRIYRARGIDRLRAVNDTLSGGDWAFKSLYTDGVSGTKGVGSIRSFSVHPRNGSVYVLKAGSLTRHSVCRRFPLDCEVNPSLAAASGEGRSDDGQTVVPAVQEFPVPVNYDQVFVDYTRQRVYLLSSDRGSIVEVRNALTAGAPISSINKTVAAPADLSIVPIWDNTNPAVAAPAVTPWIPAIRSASTVAPVSGWLNGRISGLTLDPSGSELTIADNSEQAWDSITYNTTLYRVRDAFISDPTGYLSAQVHAISQ
jgi:type II secretory pathway pseudopilin PulG